MSSLAHHQPDLRRDRRCAAPVVRTRTGHGPPNKCILAPHTRGTCLTSPTSSLCRGGWRFGSRDGSCASADVAGPAPAGRVNRLPGIGERRPGFPLVPAPLATQIEAANTFKGPACLSERAHTWWPEPPLWSGPMKLLGAALLLAAAAICAGVCGASPNRGPTLFAGANTQLAPSPRAVLAPHTN